jgi:hydroxyethylthiazole kinase
MTSGADLARLAAAVLGRIRERRPRIHCLTNSVVQKLTADGLSAIGAMPSMTSSPDEIVDFTGGADGLLVNLGTLDGDRRDVIGTAVRVMNGNGHPWVLDPVLCHVSPLRRAFAQDLLAKTPTVLRGNAAEVAVLQAGVGYVTIETGKTDRIARDGRSFQLANGHPWMPMVTGTGCLSGAIVAAFLAVEADPLLASAAAMLAFDIAGEMAASHARGPGSFEPALLDALSLVTETDLLTRVRLQNDEG